MEGGSCWTGGTTSFTETVSGGASGGWRKGTRGGPVALIHIRLVLLEFIGNLKMRLEVKTKGIFTIILIG
jgi:hypothetical protein